MKCPKVNKDWEEGRIKQQTLHTHFILPVFITVNHWIESEEKLFFESVYILHWTHTYLCICTHLHICTSAHNHFFDPFCGYTRTHPRARVFCACLEYCTCWINHICTRCWLSITQLPPFCHSTILPSRHSFRKPWFS